MIPFFSSCIEYTAKFKLNKDGSGTLDLTYIIQKTLLENSPLAMYKDKKFIFTKNGWLPIT